MDYGSRSTKRPAEDAVHSGSGTCRRTERKSTSWRSRTSRHSRQKLVSRLKQARVTRHLSTATLSKATSPCVPWLPCSTNNQQQSASHLWGCQRTLPAWVATRRRGTPNPSCSSTTTDRSSRSTTEKAHSAQTCREIGRRDLSYPTRCAQPTRPSTDNKHHDARLPTCPNPGSTPPPKQWRRPTSYTPGRA